MLQPVVYCSRRRRTDLHGSARHHHHRQLRRWIFYINISTGLLALWMCSKVVHDPDYLKAQQLAKRKKKGAPFDTLGLCLLCLTLVSWEIVLSKSQEWDWLGDPFFRVQTVFRRIMLDD